MISFVRQKRFLSQWIKIVSQPFSHKVKPKEAEEKSLVNLQSKEMKIFQKKNLETIKSKSL